MFGIFALYYHNEDYNYSPETTEKRCLTFCEIASQMKFIILKKNQLRVSQHNLLLSVLYANVTA